MQAAQHIQAAQRKLAADFPSAHTELAAGSVAFLRSNW
jgi:hypothetical protein